MKHIHTRLLLLLLILLSLTVFACKTVDYQGELQVIETQVADIHLKLTLQDRESLLNMYRKDENPFIDYPGKFPRKYFFVFRTEITSETSTVEFNQSDITIQAGSETYKCLNTFTLKKAWEPYYDSDRQQLHKEIIINKTLKPADFIVTPEAPYKGTIAFLIPKPEETEAVILLGAKTPEGDEGVIEIPFEIKMNSDEGFPQENTGIFAE